MTLAYRSKSPILKSVNARTKELISDGEKIHRIVPRTEAHCLFVHYESPNCIWFRLLNHISDQLQIVLVNGDASLNRPLMKLDFGSKSSGENRQLKPYDYVMAPLAENVYARARVVLTRSHSRLQFVYVHFIDHGSGAWMNQQCLAKMDPHFKWHPWQAFPVALFKLQVCRELMFGSDCDENDWPKSVRNQLECILGEYAQFKLIPVADRFRNNYSDYTRAEVYGIMKENVGKKNDECESISHRLAMECAPFDMIENRVYAAQHQRLSRPMEVGEFSAADANKLMASMPEWRKKFPIEYLLGQIDSINAQLESLHLHDDWTGEDQAGQPQIQPVSIQWLRRHCCAEPEGNAMMMLGLDWNSLKSPYELYAYPLPVRSTNGSAEKGKNPIRQLYERQTKLAAELDQFYGNQANRRAVDANAIARRLMGGEGTATFAVYETQDEVRGSSFRRVEVLFLRETQTPTINFDTEFCRVRFLDVGGSAVVPLAGLLRIHSRHCAHRPLCIQLCMADIQPPAQASSWTQEECRFFKGLIRVDVPVKCILMDQGSIGRATYNSLAHHWPGVFLASRMHICNENLEQRMVEEGKADRIEFE